MKNIYSTLLIIIFTLLSCSSKEDKHIGELDPIKCLPVEVPYAYKKSIYDKGDVKAYLAVKHLFSQKGESYEVLFYSMMMANRHHYKPAYFDVYMCLWQAFNQGKSADLWDMTRFDLKTRAMALYYLKLSAETGNKQAKEIITNSYLK